MGKTTTVKRNKTKKIKPSVDTFADSLGRVLNVGHTAIITNVNSNRCMSLTKPTVANPLVGNPLLSEKESIDVFYLSNPTTVKDGIPLSSCHFVKSFHDFAQLPATVQQWNLCGTCHKSLTIDKFKSLKYCVDCQYECPITETDAIPDILDSSKKTYSTNNNNPEYDFATKRKAAKRATTTKSVRKRLSSRRASLTDDSASNSTNSKRKAPITAKPKSTTSSSLSITTKPTKSKRLKKPKLDEISELIELALGCSEDTNVDQAIVRDLLTMKYELTPTNVFSYMKIRKHKKHYKFHIEAMRAMATSKGLKTIRLHQNTVLDLSASPDAILPDAHKMRLRKIVQSLIMIKSETEKTTPDEDENREHDDNEENDEDKSNGTKKSYKKRLPVGCWLYWTSVLVGNMVFAELMRPVGKTKKKVQECLEEYKQLVLEHKLLDDDELKRVSLLENGVLDKPK